MTPRRHHYLPAVLSLAACAVGLAAMAAPKPVAETLPPDVPAHHWAAPAVRSVVSKKLMTTTPKKTFNGDSPVTRYELAETLDRFVRYIEDSHKPLTAGKETTLPVLPATVKPTTKAALNHLVGGGFIPVDSPLLTKPGKGAVTAKELATTMAQVTDRLLDRGLPAMKQPE